MEHISDGWGKAYNPNCMCNECHSIWELLFMAGDSVTINGWVDGVNSINRNKR